MRKSEEEWEYKEMTKYMQRERDWFKYYIITKNGIINPQKLQMWGFVNNFVNRFN